MLKAYRTLVATLGVACVLTIAVPAEAQTSKTTTRTRRPSTVRVSTRTTRTTTRAQARPQAPSRTRTQAQSVRTSSTTRLRIAANQPPAQLRNTVRVNRAASSNGVSDVRTQRTVRTQGSAISRQVLTRPAINVASDKTRTRSDDAGTLRRRPGRDDREPADAIRQRTERGTSRYTVRRAPRHTYRDGYRDGYRSGYREGYTWGYYRGHHRGYHVGYVHNHYYRHRHYYGPHVVLGYHFGGFGFYHGHWHFAIVIGDPYVHHHHHYYHYSWWDGRGATLVSWQNAAQAYPADYRFVEGSCVGLWLRTVDGSEYQIKIDPRYYNANNPGDLYAELWAELEQEGQLQIEDINGAIHVFPAGTIQQIEATSCR